MGKGRGREVGGRGRQDGRRRERGLGLTDRERLSVRLIARTVDREALWTVVRAEGAAGRRGKGLGDRTAVFVAGAPAPQGGCSLCEGWAYRIGSIG